MCKLLLITTFIALSLIGFSQNDVKPDYNTCLFGYISEDDMEFESVIRYLGSIDIEVLSNCPEEKLIFVKLNIEFKDYTDLFQLIEKKYIGTCYYKSDINNIPKYNKCRDRNIKQNI